MHHSIMFLLARDTHAQCKNTSLVNALPPERIPAGMPCKLGLYASASDLETMPSNFAANVGKWQTCAPHISLLMKARCTQFLFGRRLSMKAFNEDAVGAGTPSCKASA